MQHRHKIHCSAMQHWTLKPYICSYVDHDMACMMFMLPAGPGSYFDVCQSLSCRARCTHTRLEASNSLWGIDQGTPYQCTICWCLRKDCEGLCCNLCGLLHSSFQ